MNYDSHSTLAAVTFSLFSVHRLPRSLARSLDRRLIISACLSPFSFTRNPCTRTKQQRTLPLYDESQQRLGCLQGASKVVVVVDRQQVIVLRVDVGEQHQVAVGQAVQLGHLPRKVLELRVLLPPERPSPELGVELEISNKWWSVWGVLVLCVQIRGVLTLDLISIICVSARATAGGWILFFDIATTTR